jgi:hypothetical protein
MEEIKKLQQTIMNIPFLTAEQRELFSTGITYLTLDELNKFLELLLIVYYDQTEKLLKVFEILTEISQKIGGGKNDRKRKAKMSLVKECRS